MRKKGGEVIKKVVDKIIDSKKPYSNLLHEL